MTLPTFLDSVAMIETHMAELDAEVMPELFYRDRDIWPAWHPLPNLQAARRLILNRTERSPWLSLQRRVDDPAGEPRWCTYEILGWADRVYVCGDVAGEGWQWRWSSWPAGTVDGDVHEMWIGPPDFRLLLWDVQVVTVGDALAQLEPGLRAIPQKRDHAPGFVWLDRRYDAAANEIRRS